jgi:type I restriction enzyme M protein
MTKRHTIHPGNWESIFGRLEELVLANSGEDEFEEIFKLLVAKLYAELAPDGRLAFRGGATPAETAESINGLIGLAAERWKGIVPVPARSRLTDEHLAVCVEAIEAHSVLDTGLEVLDGVFEYLVSRSAKGAKGQYFTPRHVIDCCVEIMAPGPRELVVDPACGSGGFLVHVLLHLTAQNPSLDRRAFSENQLWGFDLDERVVQVAKALMLVAGDGHSNLFRLNSLLTPGSGEDLFTASSSDEPSLTIEDVVRTRLRNFRGYDVVLTNPPFAGEIKESGLLSSYQLHRQGRRIERDVLFLERCVRLLRPGGRLGIVLPHNKLGASAWSYAREWLLREMRVVAVLGLARNTFLPHTHQKADVVFGIRREQPGPPRGDEPILFLISDEAGKDSKGRIVERPGSQKTDPAWIRASHDFGELVGAFHNFIGEAGIPWGNTRV